jgi:regulator of protease activity HflC (stomatin/prohibitin superfamily)
MSIWGVVLHTLFAGGLLIYALLSNDHAALTSSVFAGVGLLAWLALALTFDQHRRERLEAMEAESLAKGGSASASVFQTDQSLRPAAKRLAGLHRVFIPAVSVLIALTLIGVGLWRYWSFNNLMTATGGGFTPPRHDVAGLILGFIIAATGFVFARYAAGMAKQAAWANLRAGASFAAGSALLGLLHAVALLVDQVGPDTLVRLVPYVAAILLVVIGIELSLGFVLSLYRPRRTGEVPRPAFDSRLLSFVATPDTIAKSVSDAINYQLGFDVTSGWFYQLLSKTVLPLLFVGGLLIWLMSSVVVIQPHQRAMILRWGEPIRDNVAPGLTLKAPWPIDRVYVPELLERDERGRFRTVDRTVTGLRTLDLATRRASGDTAMLWTNQHPGEEIYQYVRASSQGIAGDPASAATPQGGGAAGAALRSDELVDLALISAEIPLQFVVRDVRAFDELAAPEQRDALLQTIAQREVTRYFQGVNLDQALGAGRAKIGADLAQRVQDAFDRLGETLSGGARRGAGVEVVYVGVAGVHPPKDTAKSFESPVQADARKVANIQAAGADATAELTRAVGDVALADQIIRELDKLKAVSGGAFADAKGDTKVDPKAQAAIAAQEFVVQQLIERAGGQAATELAQARATRWERHMDARGRATRYAGRLAMFEASPEVYAAREYFSSLRTVMDGARVVVVGAGDSAMRHLINLEDKDLGTDVFRPKEEGAP